VVWQVRSAVARGKAEALGGRGMERSDHNWPMWIANWQKMALRYTFLARLEIDDDETTATTTICCGAIELAWSVE